MILVLAKILSLTIGVTKGLTIRGNKIWHRLHHHYGN